MKKIYTLAVMIAIVTMATAQHYEYDLKVVIEKTNGDKVSAEKFNEGILELTFNDVSIVPKTGAKTTVTFDALKNISFQDIYDEGYVSIEKIATSGLKAYVQGSTLIITNDQSIGEITIVSLTGQTFIRTSSKGVSANVDVACLPKGFFILRAGGETLKLLYK